MQPRRLMLRALIAIALLASTLLIASHTPTANAAPVVGPSGNAFYTPPSPLPAGKPGDVIWYRKSTFSSDLLLGLPKTNINAFQVLYRSTDALGKPIAVSGTVLVPKSFYFGTRPIVGYTVGTQGIGDTCAPSRSLPTGKLYEGSVVQGMLDKGWAVSITDYQGLGTPGTHTYMVGNAAGTAVLDSVRAATRFPGTGLSTSAPVGIFGYSQGGQAAGFAGQLQPTYAPELNLKGVAAGGVPADLTRVASNLDGSAFFAFLGGAAVGLDTAYPELKLDSYLNAAGRTTFNNAKDDCLIDLLPPFAFRRISDYTTSNPLAVPAWQARLAQNKLGAVAPRVPVYLYHGLVDEIIPLDQARTLRQTYCAKGVKVQWNEMWFAEHLTGIIEGQGPAISWLGDRFANRTAPSNC